MKSIEIDKLFDEIELEWDRDNRENAIRLLASAIRSPLGLGVEKSLRYYNFAARDDVSAYVYSDKIDALLEELQGKVVR